MAPVSSAETAPDPRLTVAVLAGGRGRRFGGNKLSAQLGDARIIDHTLGRVAGMGSRLLLVGSALPTSPGVDLAQVRDAVPAGSAMSPEVSYGPLAGIVAALEVSATPLLAIVAADMPLVSPSVLRVLASRWSGEPALVAVVDGAPQPLHAVYSVAHAAAFRAAFDTGALSPVRVCHDLGARLLELDRTGSHGWHLDIDTPADLRRIQQHMDALAEAAAGTSPATGRPPTGPHPTGDPPARDPEPNSP